MTAPSILLVDDGELDRVQQLLERLRVDWVRCTNPARGDPPERPRDLIISTGPWAMKMPQLPGDTSPLWLCLYDSGFMPIRERLCAEGVHYLAPADLAPRTLELFLRQLLHHGDERRNVRRIPLECEIDVAVGFERRKALLLELSRESCVFATDTEVPLERRVVIRLPESLTGRDELELPGHVVRTSGGASSDSEPSVVNVFRFGDLEADAMGMIQALISGDTPAAEVTPLQAEPAALREDDPDMPERLDTDVESDERLAPDIETSEGWRPQQGERRGAPRRTYTRCIDAIRWQGDPEPQIVFGRDLSETGLRIATSPPPEIGSAVALALYGGGSREEPVLVDADVVRIDGEEVGLRFLGLNAATRHGLQRLLAASARLEALVDQGGAVYVAELIDE